MNMRANAVRFKGFVADRIEAGAVLKKPGDLAVISREKMPRWIVLRCPSGCGDDVLLNLDRRTGRAWSLYRESGKRVSIYPSIWRDTGCGSHFIVWKNRVIWCDYDEALLDVGEAIDADKSASVLKIIGESQTYISYEEIATRLNAIPWEILTLCHRLVREGLIEEGRIKERGRFKLVDR
ncbi:MAG: hypothetical protein LAN61_04855 [Acidobacteriia bacterium]|nr:hypothetical protein [Terriglobia bacterium]